MFTKCCKGNKEQEKGGRLDIYQRECCKFYRGLSLSVRDWEAIFSRLGSNVRFPFLECFASHFTDADMEDFRIQNNGTPVCKRLQRRIPPQDTWQTWNSL